MPTNRMVRFKIAGRWTPWYSDKDNLSFLTNNVEVEAMEETYNMTKAEWEKLSAGLKE